MAAHKSHGFFLFLFCILFLLSSCSSSFSFITISGPEKVWALKHPIMVIPAKKATKEARKKSQQLLKDQRLDGNPDGGSVDAFRHAYWMALLSQKMNVKKALALGLAHEKNNYRNFLKNKKDEEFSVQDSIATAMDLFNNAVGASLGETFKRIGKDSLAERIIQSIKEGKLKVIFTSPEGSYLNCNGRKLLPEEYIGKWNNERCLVNSQ